MTRMEALEAVAEAAQKLLNRNLGREVIGWAELDEALRALPTEPAQKPQTVTLAVWEGDEGDMRLVRAGSHAESWPPPWRRLGTVTLPLDQEAGR